MPLLYSSFLGPGGAGGAPPGGAGWEKVSESVFTLAVGTGSEVKSLPGTPQQGDIVLLARACERQIDAATADVLTAGYTHLFATASSFPGAALHYKIMGVSPDSQVEIEQQFERIQAGLIQIWRGVDSGTPIDATLQSASGSGTPDPPSYTSVTDGALVIAAGFLDNDDSAGSVAAPSGFGDLLAADTGQASTAVGATVMIASLEQETAGAIDPGAFGVLFDGWHAVTFALRPAA